MRRIVGLLLVLLVFLSGCVQTDSTFLENAPNTIAPGSPPASTGGQSPKPTLPPVSTTPGVSRTPPPALADPAPQTPGSTPQDGVQKTPQPGTSQPTEPPNGAQVLVPDLPEERRLYFYKQPGFDAGRSYSFKDGVYTEEELHMLYRLLSMQNWNSLAALLDTFGTTLAPDIRMSDFARDGLFAPSLTVQEPYFDADTELAYIVLRHTDMQAQAPAEYILMFKKERQGYAPLSVIAIALKGEAYYEPEGWFETLGEDTFLVCLVQEDIGGEKMLREKWYNCADGLLALNLVFTGERKSDFSEEVYQSTIVRESKRAMEHGYAWDVSEEVLHQIVGLQGSPTPISLSSGEEFLLYYHTQLQAFYCDASRQVLFADTGKIEEGQYKHIFDQQLKQLAEIGRTQLEKDWANAMLQAADWDAALPEAPSPEVRKELGYEDSDVNVVYFYESGYEHKLFSEGTLRKLSEDIESAKMGSLMQLLGTYGIFDAREFQRAEEGESASRFDVQLKAVNNLTCSYDIHTAYERMACIQVGYSRNGSAKELLLLFELYGNAWRPCAMYEYGKRSIEADTTLFYDAELLQASFGWQVQDKQPVSKTILFEKSRRILSFLSAYTDKDGTAYSIRHTYDEKRFGRLGSIVISATLGGEDAPLLQYTLPIWLGDGFVYANDPDAELLLSGQVSLHEGFSAAFQQALDERAQKESAQQESPAPEEAPPAQEPPAEEPPADTPTADESGTDT